MNWWQKPVAAFRTVFRKQELDADMDEEMRSHIELQTQENMKEGMNLEEARYAALRGFGRVDAIKERVRDERGMRWLEDFMQDIRFGLRMLRKNGAFTAVAMVSLGIGIGINSTIFSALDAAFLRPIPFQDANQIVRLEWPALSFSEYEEFRSQAQSLASLAASSRHAAVLQGSGAWEEVGSLNVSANYFSTLGIRPALGRLFSAGEPGRSSERLVVLSYGLWQRRFGGDPRIVGQTITLTGAPWTVLGVAAKGFTGEFRIPAAELWFPADVLTYAKDSPEFQLIGRLRPGFTVQQATAEAKVLCSRLPDNRGKDVWLWSESDWNADKGGRLSVLIMCLVGVVLLVACANVASLLLARNEERRHEIAMRLALGGGRLRLLRQFLAEGLVLGLLGGVAGLLLTVWAIRLIPSLLPLGLLSFTPKPAVDHRVLVLTLGLSCLATMVFAVVPGWRASRLELGPLIKGGGVPLLGRIRWLNSRNSLVVVQLAVALVFLISAGLFVHGFLRGLQSDMGFTRRNVLLLTFWPGTNGLGGDQGLARFARAQERLRSLPGVEGVSMVAHPPFALSGVGMQVKALRPDEDLERKDSGSKALCNVVEPGYFAALGIPLLQGRDFTEHDDRKSERVMLISEAMARKFWLNENPLGKTLRVGFDRPVPREVVGVVRNVANARLGEKPEPNVYLPFRQEPVGDMVIAVATRGNPVSLAEAVRRELSSADEQLNPLIVETMSGLVHLALFPQWMGLWLGGALGLLAFLLAVAGLYGVISYSVSRRTRELGVRMALGAGRGDTIWLVLKQGLVLGLIGVGIGLPAAIAAGVVLRSLLFGVGAADPLVLCGATVVVVGVAVAASYLPARRAASVDPMAALRCE